MIEPLLIHCDGPGCSATRRATNHWYVVNVGGEAGQGYAETFYALPWGRASHEEIKAGKHACSHSCAQRLFEQWLSAMEKPTAVSA